MNGNYFHNQQTNGDMERVLKFVGTFSAGAAAGYYFHYDAKKEKNYDKRELWKQELMERSYDDNDLLKLYDKTSEEIVEQLHSLRTADETFSISHFKDQEEKTDVRDDIRKEENEEKNYLCEGIGCPVST